MHALSIPKVHQFNRYVPHLKFWGPVLIQFAFLLKWSLIVRVFPLPATHTIVLSSSIQSQPHCSRPKPRTIQYIDLRVKLEQRDVLQQPHIITARGRGMPLLIILLNRGTQKMQFIEFSSMSSALPKFIDRIIEKSKFGKLFVVFRIVWQSGKPFNRCWAVFSQNGLALKQCVGCNLKGSSKFMLKLNNPLIKDLGQKWLS